MVSYFSFDSPLFFYCIYYIAMVTVECVHSSVVTAQRFLDDQLVIFKLSIEYIKSLKFVFELQIFV